MSDTSVEAVIYHLTKTLETQTTLIQEMQKDIHAIRLDLEVFKARQTKERVKDAATGSGLGAAVIALIAGAYQWFKSGGTH